MSEAAPRFKTQEEVKDWYSAAEKLVANPGKSTPEELDDLKRAMEPEPEPKK